MNKIKGTIKRDINGEMRTLAITVNEWCELESQLGMSSADIIKQLNKMVEDEDLNMTFCRALFCAALGYSMPDITPRKAGEIMAEMGLQEAAVITGEVILASVPEEDGKTKVDPKPAAIKVA